MLKKIFLPRWVISRWWWCLLRHSQWAHRTSRLTGPASLISPSLPAAWSKAIAIARLWPRLLTTLKWALTRTIPHSRSSNKGSAMPPPLMPPLGLVSLITRWQMVFLLHNRWWWTKIWQMTTPTPLCCSHLFHQGRWGDSCLGGRCLKPTMAATLMMSLISYHRRFYRQISKNKDLINSGKKRLSCLSTSESLELTSLTLMILKW